ncbi:GntR family transcriptional regulator [Nonomuraea wenchangensis]|uniref:DNA-binding transcriptional regulator, GntR family n=1 Tax=Nonomuraea wenchangensis TaxID=568860 RepID=A0A1I0LU19_9ACTN|nr:GntR family transcriptional regulator [Nonomuraea wenchangensis]SEU46671.1 DNA-binding transcriptional regulator, GntR family [Nonomuraea wenchangensis]
MAEKPLPRYQQVADDLRAKIVSGIYPVGQPLPHTRDLIRKYGLGSDNVLLKAYKILKEEGLIRRNAAVGMIVQDPNPPVVDLTLHNPLGHGPLPWAECCKLAGLEGRTVTTSVTSRAAAQDEAALLGVAPGAAVVIRARTAHAGDVPVRLDEAIYPAELVEGTPIAAKQQVPGGIYGTLAQAGHAPAAVVRRAIGARPATGDEAKGLGLAAGAWVLAADQVIADGRGRAVELLRIIANPARVRFLEQALSLQSEGGT